MTVAKFGAWIATGSGSMFSEALHSLADVCNQALLAYGTIASLTRSLARCSSMFDSPAVRRNLELVARARQGPSVWLWTRAICLVVDQWRRHLLCRMWRQRLPRHHRHHAPTRCELGRPRSRCAAVLSGSRNRAAHLRRVGRSQERQKTEHELHGVRASWTRPDGRRWYVRFHCQSCAALALARSLTHSTDRSNQCNNTQQQC